MTAASTGPAARSPGCRVQRLDRPVNLSALARLNPARYPFLLQSTAAGPDLARFDILFAFPGETLELSHSGELGGPFSATGTDFLAALDSWWLAETRPSAVQDAAGLPFRGGWFVYLGYELAGQIEPTLGLDAAPGLPVAFATRIPLAVVADRVTGASYLVAEEGHDHASAAVVADIADIDHSDASGLFDKLPPLRELLEAPAEDFLRAVDAARRYIAAGDIFQANLSRCWDARFAAPVEPAALYSRLCVSNPAPFAGMVLRDDFSIVSSSPERLVRRRGERIDTRPIAGTRPRDEAPELMQQQVTELLANPKERAEHIMLIDLERNDLGRVSVGGSVRVDEYMVVESYAHVHHIVSNICGTARPGLTPGQLIGAVFPGGTITGCPKVRCMEIIRELEQRFRGPYTGSMGYLNLNGDCDLNILIRTMLVRGEHVQFAAGAGIVADSDPRAELEETRAKAKGMLRALEHA